MSNPVNPASPTDPPPHVGFQSIQSHADHRRNVAVNPKSLSYCIIAADTNDPTDLRSKSPMVHDYVGQPGFKKANVPRSIMDKGEADRRRTKRKRCRATSSEKTDLPEPPARPAPRTPAPAPHSDAGNPGTPPEAPRAWTEEDDQQLCSLKADNRSKYSYKIAGQEAQQVHRGCHAALEEPGTPQESSGTESEDYLNVSNTACPVVSGNTGAALPRIWGMGAMRPFGQVRKQSPSVYVLAWFWFSVLLLSLGAPAVWVPGWPLFKKLCFLILWDTCASRRTGRI